jgi:hypothetical protein
MSERFKQILEEASKKVSEWPEWKKSDALKKSEQGLASEGDKRFQAKNDELKANSAASGK